MASHTMLPLLLMCLSFSGALAWQKGRATYYGTDGWSIHTGSCGFGYQWPDVGTGFDVAAIADAAPEFGGSCGRCYEVKCDPQSAVPDGYGQTHERSSVCYDSSKTIVVRTVDNCPCDYPNNAYSNKRWCCYDNGMTHFDLSIWAYERLSDVKWGVMGIQYQEVPCTKAADNPAPPIANPTPPEEPQSWMVKPSEDTIYVKRFDSVGEPQGAVTVSGNVDAAPPSDKITYESTFKGGLAPNSVPNGSTTASAGSDSSSSSTSSEGCTDNAPDTGSCQQQLDWGKCNDEWLTSGNFCQTTCGRCSSSSSPSSPSESSSSPSDASSSSPSSSPSGSSADCQDTAVPYTISYGSCQDQKNWGKCGEQWMIDGSYCASTCGRCGSSDSGSSSQSPSSSGDSSSSSPCEDAPVPEEAECWQQKQWGKCSEITANGYCKATCGACSAPTVSAYDSSFGQGRRL
ncbi:hypothetical protein ACKKBG_A37945 [Auxenochlorella protothecoides x Auxenochlorella symbiontica]